MRASAVHPPQSSTCCEHLLQDVTRLYHIVFLLAQTPFYSALSLLQGLSPGRTAAHRIVFVCCCCLLDHFCFSHHAV